jgi:hypothetical protein
MSSLSRASLTCWAAAGEAAAISMPITPRPANRKEDENLFTESLQNEFDPLRITS